MPIVQASYYTHPACPWSWAWEPSLRRLEVEFGDSVRVVPVMGGSEGWPGDPENLVEAWLDAGDASGMPFDPRIWTDAPVRSAQPACLAVVAAGMQGEEPRDRYLRRLREGLMCGRRRLDTADALLAASHDVPGLDVARLERDLRSSATVERFGEELERCREVGELPTIAFGDAGAVTAREPYENWRAAALAAGAQPTGEPSPTVEQALGRFGVLATPEVAAACDLPGPRAQAELWRLAVEWRVVAERRLTGDLWRLA